VSGADRLPDGFAVRLDRRARRLDGGAALLGLSPGRLLHLAPAARRLLGAGGDLVVRGDTGARLARRLLDAGVAHPVTTGELSGPSESDVTVVVPVRDRPDGLDRLLAALADTAPELAEVIVVDDGSADPHAHRRVVAGSRLGSRLRLVRHPTPRGPAAARNTGLTAAGTGLVAFLDSDVVPQQGWLAPLRAHLADPAAVLAAPRIVGLPGAGASWLDRYEGLRSSLDLGPDPGPIVPRTRVAYVPSAALLVRRAALGAGFDEGMRVAEDVDLVLRLHAAGCRLRYEPAALVAHEHRVRPADWWSRKVFYGTGAAPLALRHPGSVPPIVLAPWAVAVCLLIGAQRRSGVLGAAAVTVLAWWRVRRTLAPKPAAEATKPAALPPKPAGEGPTPPAEGRVSGSGTPSARLRQPGRVAALLVGLGLVSAADQAAGLLVRHWWPAAAVGALLSRRVRRAVLVASVGEGLADWYRHRPRAGRPGLDPGRYLLVHRADDLGYGVGLWWGAYRGRTLAPLRPEVTGLSAWLARRCRRSSQWSRSAR
jgi:mycofactocin system glycosyltransferase